MKAIVGNKEGNEFNVKYKENNVDVSITEKREICQNRPEKSRVQVDLWERVRRETNKKIREH